MHIDEHKSNLLSFISANKIHGKRAMHACISGMQLLHMNVTEQLLLHQNCQAYLSELASIDAQLIAEHASIDSIFAWLHDIYAKMLSAKQEEHAKVYTFINKICKAQLQPCKHECTDWLDNPYEIVVAHNRIWVNFFDRHAVCFMFDQDGSLRCYIDHVRELMFCAGNSTFDFRDANFEAIAFGMQIVNALMNNPTFKKLLLSWHHYTCKIDTQRINMLQVLNAYNTSLQGTLQCSKTNISKDIKFVVRYDMQSNKSKLDETISAYKTGNVIGILHHKLWPRETSEFERLTITPFTSFAYEAEYEIASKL